MSGRWKVKHPDMQQLALQAQRLARQLGAVRYTWVPRAQNSAADALANSAMDGRPVHRDAAAEPVVLEDDIQPTAGGRDVRGSTVQPGTGPAPVVTTVTHLLRHGQTEHTPERRYSGRNDLPLSLTGRAEAEAAAVRAGQLGIDVVVSSPIRRTRETAETVAAALGVPVELDDDLAELDFGDLEGLTLDEALAEHPLAVRRFTSDVTVKAPGGESIADVSARVARARRRILDRHAGRTVLVVSHVTPIKLLLAAGLEVGDEVVHRVFLEAASLSTVAWSSDGRASVRLVNDTSHLR
jgi:probable phosphoglycerate mutase